MEYMQLVLVAAPLVLDLDLDRRAPEKKTREIIHSYSVD